MRKLLVALALATPLVLGMPLVANADTTIGLSAGQCNVAQTVCTIPNDVGEAMTFTYNSPDVTLVVIDVTTASVTYTGQTQFGSPTTHTNYLIVTPFAVALSPNATLSGNLRKTRSGSGRGGWSWHTHWDFQMLVIQ